MSGTTLGIRTGRRPSRSAAFGALATLAALSLGFAGGPAAPAFAGPEYTTAPAGKFAFVGGTVHTAAGPPIENGTVLIDRGRIVAVGAQLSVPPDATVIDCHGKHVSPGFISANTVLGLIEVQTIEGSDDTRETGTINPNIRAEVMYNPDSDVIPVTRINGVTSVLVVPGGGAIHGTSALMHLDGWTPEDMTLKAPVALHVDWPRMRPIHAFFIPQSDEEQMKARDAALAGIRDAFDDARAYETARTAESGRGVPRHDDDVKWDAMRRVVRGEVPVFFHADAAAQIRSILAFVDEQKLAHVAIVGGRDAWMFADELKARDIAVIVGGTLEMPLRRYEAYDAAYTAPARLAAAGVRYCIADEGGGFAVANTRNLPYHAAMAAAFGLPRDEALRAITLYPAQILGVGDRLGSLEPGKIADLQITDGDPLEDATHCEQVYINGRAIPMESRQTRLFKKYDARPRGPRARPR
ncbi:MAG TPA: amidohydrolase family protein [Candidatus Acidoferrales bacterium]|nr:amidohydrolase family protein [Candidatus Acidoferrales bacterium]